MLLIEPRIVFKSQVALGSISFYTSIILFYIVRKYGSNTQFSKVNLDDLDIYILQSLQKNSRTHYEDIGEKKGKSKSTIANRIKRLSDEKVITNWAIRVNPEKIGFDLTVLINIQIDVPSLDEINNELAKIPELFAIYNVTGSYDIVAIGRFYNRQHLDQTIHLIIKIPNIQRTSSNVALRTLKEDFRVYLPEI